MHPFLPFAVLPIAIASASFAASNWSNSDPGRYRVPRVEQIENPSVPADVRPVAARKPDIRVAAFLPHTVPEPPAPVPVLVLHSVLTGKDIYLATINGQLVREGDSIKGYRVMKIAADGVDLVKSGVRRHLPMRPLHELPAPRQAEADPLREELASGQHDTETGQDIRSISEIAQF